jgi:hypothetical protein
MRAQNVEALRKLLEEAVAASRGGYRLTSRCISGDPERPIYDDPGRLAEWLVEAGGVLVPTAVTEQEAMDLLHKVPAEIYARVPEESKGIWLREGLRRIAGDTPFGDEERDGEAVLCLKGTHRWGVGTSDMLPVDAETAHLGF